MVDRHAGREHPVFDLGGDPEKYISLIRNKGVLSRVMQARVCPCNETGTPDIHCNMCKGRGYLYSFQRSFLQSDEDSDRSRDGTEIYPYRVPMLLPQRVERLLCDAQGGITEFEITDYDSETIYIDPGDEPIKHYEKIRVSYFFDRFESVTDELVGVDLFNKCVVLQNVIYDVGHRAGKVFNITGDIVKLIDIKDGYTQESIFDDLIELGGFALRRNKMYFMDITDLNYMAMMTWVCMSQYNIHCADSAEHTNPDNDNLVILGPCPAPETTEELICGYVAQLLTKYRAHIDDAGLETEWAYHSGQGESVELDDYTAPENLYECALRLTDFIEKFNTHDCDEECHTVADLHRAFNYLVSYEYCPPTKVLVADIEQRNDKTEKWSEGMYEGDCKMSLEPWYQISEGDIITLLSVILYKNELITHTETSAGDSLFEFDISSLHTEIIDEDGNKYELYNDYVLSDRKILWTETGSKPAAGKKYSVRYGYHPTYVVFKDNAQPNALENKMYPVTVLMKPWSKIKKEAPRRTSDSNLWE